MIFFNYPLRPEPPLLDDLDEPDDLLELLLELLAEGVLLLLLLGLTEELLLLGLDVLGLTEEFELLGLDVLGLIDELLLRGMLNVELDLLGLKVELFLTDDADDLLPRLAVEPRLE